MSHTHQNQRRSIVSICFWRGGWTRYTPTRRCGKPRCPSNRRSWAERSGYLPPPRCTTVSLRWPGSQWRRKADRGERETRLSPGGWLWTSPSTMCCWERWREMRIYSTVTNDLCCPHSVHRHGALPLPAEINDESDTADHRHNAAQGCNNRQCQEVAHRSRLHLL